MSTKAEPTASAHNEASNTIPQPALRVHHGAIDQKTVTSRSPLDAMKRVLRALENMGLHIQQDSAYKLRCIRPKGDPIVSEESPLPRGLRKVQSISARLADSSAPPVVISPPRGSDADDDLEKSSDDESDASTKTLSSPTVYGDPASQDQRDKVTMSIELTKLDQLEGMYSLDIRRLKGNLRSYKFLYDSLRDRADLSG